MKVELTVHVRTDGGVLLARQDEEITASFDTLRHGVRWESVSFEVVTAALDKAQATAAGMVCPDDHS